MTEHLRKLYTFLSLMLFLALLCGGAAAQTEVTGAVTGRVFDQKSNTPLVGVVVKIINEETEVPTSAKTDANGNFSKQGLPPGRYRLEVNYAGYKSYKVTQLVSVTDTKTVKPQPIPLESVEQIVAAPPAPSPAPGAPTPAPDTTAAAQPSPASSPVVLPPENVNVTESLTGEASTTDARLSGSFSRATVNALPLGTSTLTRSFDEFAFLLPGVALPPQTSGGIAGPGVGPGVGSSGQFAVNGLRSRGNNFTVDGSDNNDEDIGVRRQGFFSLVPQSIESIEQYQVTTALAPAQFGRNFGAQVNAVSRSGGAKFHGDVYGFGNASQLNARNAFDTDGGGAGSFALRSESSSGSRPALLDGNPLMVRREGNGKDSFTLGQGGFTFGGPIIPQRAFFFVSAERQVLNASKEVSFAVPTVDQRGIFGSGATGLRDSANNPVFPTRLQGDAVFSLIPFANNPSGIFGSNTFTQVLPASSRGTIASGKFDTNFRVSGREQNLTGRYNYTDDRRGLPVTGGAIFSALNARVRTQNFSTFLRSELNGSESSHPLLNELRLSYGRTELRFDEVRDPSLLPSAFGRNTPFLLNRRYVVNDTLPFATSFCPGGSVCYDTVIGQTTELGLLSGANPADGAIGPIGQVVIAGFSPLGVDVFSFPQQRVNNTYQVADNVSWRLERHALAFGADVRRAELNSDQPRNARPLITFGGTPALSGSRSLTPLDLAAAGAPSGNSLTLTQGVAGSANIGLRYYQLYFFGQDEWRITPSLSLSYGLRYEYGTVPQENNNLIENTFNATQLSLLPDLRRFIAGRTRIYDPDRNNFSPRLGFAYARNFLTGRTTVVRAGYGLYYDQVVGAVVSQSRNVYPSFLTVNTGGGRSPGGGQEQPFNLFNFGLSLSANECIGLFVGATPFCYTVPLSINRLNAPFTSVVEFNRDNRVNGFGATLPARDLQSPEAHQYTVSLEQQIKGDTYFSLSYVGTTGRKLLRFTTPNLGPNVILLPRVNNPVINNGNEPNIIGRVIAPGNRPCPATPPFPTFNNITCRPFPTAGAVNIFETTGRSRYNALQAQVRGRYAQRMQYQFSYTLSEVKDDVSDVFDLAGAFSLPQNSLAPAGEYAHANFDARHRLAYSFIYDFGRPDASRGRAYRALAGGFQVAGTGAFQTGQPFTVNSIFDVNLDGNLTDRLNVDGLVRTGDGAQPIRAAGDTSGLLAPVGRDGLVARNSFRAGRTLDLNLSLIKRFSFTEAQGLTFRMDVFNFIDRANFGVPVRFLEAPGFGRATETTTPGRRIQFGLKYSF